MIIQLVFDTLRSMGICKMRYSKVQVSTMVTIRQHPLTVRYLNVKNVQLY